MKHIIALILLFIFFQPLKGQLSDDFSDGEFLSNPTWSGDINNFIINADGELQLNTTGTDTSILFTAVEIPDSTVWEFEFNLDFAPSSNNRLRIYLQSNTSDFPNVDGYFLEIGESGSDDALKLFRSDDGNNTELATATLGTLGSDPAMAKVRVQRNQSGDWAIFANYENGDILNLEATAFDDTYFGENLFFGFWCKYTTSNVESFFFDNIAITALVPDITAPQVVSITPISLTELEVTFDEPIDSTTAVNVNNYFINNSIGNPQSASWNNAAQANVLLTLNNALTNQSTYNLDVQNIGDQSLNTIVSATIPFDVNFETLELINVVAISSTELELEFNKSVDPLTGSLSINYAINNGIGNPDDVDIDPVEPFRVFIELTNELANGTSYLLHVENIQDELGINIVPQDFPFSFLIGVNISPNDLIINEILFNPTTGGSDYVEIYNRSDKFLDVSDLIIANTQRTTSGTKDITSSYIMQPGEYVAFTPDREFVLNNYTVENPDVLFENSLPGYNDSDGNVSIFTRNGLDTIMIDSFDYTEDLHYPLLDDKEGTSLERISFNAPTSSNSTWHSASTLIGGGTPTFKNSQFRAPNPADDIFDIAETVFSPDGDGHKDFLLINYSLEEQGSVATANIYDAKGRLVTTLFQNELLGLEGILKWDGLTNQGKRAKLGIYIIVIKLFSTNNNPLEFKTTCVVAGNLN